MYPYHLLLSPWASSHIMHKIEAVHPPASTKSFQSALDRCVLKSECSADSNSCEGTVKSRVSSCRIGSQRMRRAQRSDALTSRSRRATAPWPIPGYSFSPIAVSSYQPPELRSHVKAFSCDIVFTGWLVAQVGEQIPTSRYDEPVEELLKLNVTI